MPICKSSKVYPQTFRINTQLMQKLCSFSTQTLPLQFQSCHLHQPLGQTQTWSSRIYQSWTFRDHLPGARSDHEKTFGRHHWINRWHNPFSKRWSMAWIQNKRVATFQRLQHKLCFCRFLHSWKFPHFCTWSLQRQYQWPLFALQAGPRTRKQHTQTFRH